MNGTDVIKRAFRMLGILAIDEAPQAHDAQYASETLDLVLAEAVSPAWGMTLTFTTESIPLAYVEPLAMAVAALIGDSYDRPAPSYRAAMCRLRAISNPYVRDKDFDGDEVVSDWEDDLDKASSYY